MARGVKKGTIVRPKAPKASAKDFALCTIKDGQSPDSKWYIGEMVAKFGGLCRCWKVFDFKDVDPEDVAKMTKKDFENLAWDLVKDARNRRNDSDEVKATLKTPEEDKAFFDQLELDGKPLPSKAYRLEKQRKVLANRRAKGLRSDGRKYAHAGLAKTLSGVLVRTPSDIVRQTVLKKVAEMMDSGQMVDGKSGRPRADSGDSQASTAASSNAPSSSSSNTFSPPFPGSPEHSPGLPEQHSETPADYPVYYSPDDLLRHGLTVDDLSGAGLPAQSTVDGGAILGNIAYLTPEEQLQLLGGQVARGTSGLNGGAVDGRQATPMDLDTTSDLVRQASERLAGLAC